MRKISAIIAAILCLSSYPAFAADSLPSPTAYLAIVRFGGHPIPNAPVEPNPKTICEIIPETIEGRNKIGEIWNKFMPVFKHQNWEYVHPDSAFYKITIYYNGHTRTFLLSDGISPTEAERKIIGTAVEAFNGIMNECKGWKPPAIP